MVWITSKMWGLLNVRVSQLERQKSLPADEITEAVRKCLKEELRTADQEMSQNDVKTYRGIADQKKPDRKG